MKNDTFRHELKYIITNEQKIILKNRLNSVLLKDDNGEDGCYTIRSLYFDDYVNSAYNEKLMGIASRNKYRIRIYDYDNSFIRLERKCKQEDYILKQSVVLSLEEYNMIINEQYDFLLKKDNRLCMDFYILCMSNHLRPKVFVDYERETYVLDAGNVRITFDSHVRAAGADNDIFDKDVPTYETLDDNTLILEVKYTEFYPRFLKNVISPKDYIHTAVSKYVLCYDKRMELLK